MREVTRKSENLQQEKAINIVKEVLNTYPKNPLSNTDGQAALTHYLHNSKNGVSKFYKKEALKHLQEILSEVCPQEGITPPLAEELLGNRMFKVEQNISFLPSASPKFSFIDLFAGIGGFRIAMQNLGGKCLFTSEWDEQAKRTYFANYGEVPFGDIRLEATKHFIPDNFDVLCAGFPCQAFSIAGRRGGFEDTRGTLFFELAEIIKRKKPKVIFLENVKGLRSHDKGKTLKTILHVLRNDLGYCVPKPEVLNARNFGVPQNRERIFIIGFRRDLNIQNFTYPQPTNSTAIFKDVKEEKEVSVKYYLSKQYLKTLRAHRARHESKGNGFGFEMIADEGIANAIVVGGMGKERNLVHDDRLTNFTPITNIKGAVNREGIRRMTPREWARLQGFPDTFKIIVSDAQAYKQFGNSVAIPVIQAIGQAIINCIKDA